MFRFFYILLLAALGLSASSAQEQARGLFPSFGPAYDAYRLTLRTGLVTEAIGPLIGREEYGPGHWLFRLSPLFSLYKNANIPQTEFELGYPVLTFDKFGPEYRFQLFQLFSFAGGQSLKGGEKDRFTLFPIYFQQRSTNRNDNYTALVPFYGTLKNRLLRDEIKFVMFPLYARTLKKGVMTWNYVYPIFHRRTAPGLKGWQFWPVIGMETKEVTTGTNLWGDAVLDGGHRKFFALWPFYFKNTLGIGTTNVQKQFVLIPFYTRQESATRETTTYGFPLGVTHTIEREKKFEEWGMPWPLVVFSKGEGKQLKRVWPLFSNGKAGGIESAFYGWPVYKYNRAVAPPLDRERTRILFFLYSDLSEKNTENGTEFRRKDFWPFYTWRKERDGSKRLQVLAPIEPILPGNKSIERVYSPVWSVWRSEFNAQTGDSSKSFLWNLFRCEHRATTRTHAALFGLFQHQRDAKGNHWRIAFIPFTTRLADRREQ